MDKTKNAWSTLGKLRNNKILFKNYKNEKQIIYFYN